MSLQEALIEKIINRSAIIGIVGLGYVGQPLALRFVEQGFSVVGFDIDDKKVAALNSGRSDIEHIADSKVAEAVESGMFCTSDFSRALNVDVIVICVPTPLNIYREPDLSYVVATLESLLPHLRKGQLLSLESTTYPGTTEEELLPRIQSQEFEIGEDFFLIYSPEREDPGNVDFTTRRIPKVVGGCTKFCLEAGQVLYDQVIDQTVPVSSTRAAEMTKLLENIHRAVNIGLVNEMKVVADKMGIDIFEVIDAANTKPFGFTAYYPGPGIGGHCIPIDPFYLTWKAREFGLHTRFIELAGEINESMPSYVVDKLTEALNNQGKSVNGSSVLILGIAYKKNVDDMRESPSVEIMELLRKKGADVHYSDPHVPKFPNMRAHNFDLESVEITEETLQRYDIVVLATEHDGFDYPMILNHSALIVDSRGKYRERNARVVTA